MIVNFNQSAAFASRIANINDMNVQNTMNALASGKRINSAKDDASGLAVSTKMKSMIKGLNQASRNIADGSSMLNVALAIYKKQQIFFKEFVNLLFSHLMEFFQPTNAL